MIDGRTRRLVACRRVGLGIAAWLLCAATAVWADDLSKLSAPDLLTKATAATQKQQGYHVRLSAQFKEPKEGKEGREGKKGKEDKQEGDDGGDAAANDGIVRGVWLKVSSFEAYAKGTAGIVKQSDGKWEDAEKATELNQKQRVVVEHPGVVLGRLARTAKSAQFDGDGTTSIGGADCRKMTIAADKATTKAVVEAHLPFMNFQGGRTRIKDSPFQMSDIDLDKTTLEYTVYVSPADGLVRRVQESLSYTVDRKPRGITEGHVTRSIDLFDFNKDLSFDITADVTARLGK